MIFIGDISLNGNFYSDSSNNIERFRKIVPIVNQSKLVFANLEMPIKTHKETNEFKNFIHYTSKIATKDVLKNLGISCVSIANNHIYDCKMPGLKSTIALLDELEIKHTGAGWRQEDIEPVTLTYNDMKIGFIAYVDKLTNPKTEYFPELFINYLELSTIKKDIDKTRAGVDFLICSLHWGSDYSNYYTKEQQRIAYEIVEAGVDFIMGHHPHTIQPFEVYKEKHIFYSLGQLCFGDFIWEGKLRSLKRKTKTGMIVSFTPGEKGIDITPTIERKGNYIDISDIEINQKLQKLNYINKLVLRNKLIAKLINFKENIFDRLFEYFFGYYRNPIKQIFAFRNIVKVKYLFRDFKKSIY